MKYWTLDMTDFLELLLTLPALIVFPYWKVFASGLLACWPCFVIDRLQELTSRSVVIMMAMSFPGSVIMMTMSFPGSIVMMTMSFPGEALTLHLSWMSFCNPHRNECSHWLSWFASLECTCRV